jgi:hypothetical protein
MRLEFFNLQPYPTRVLVVLLPIPQAHPSPLYRVRPSNEATDALRERLTEAQTAAEQFAASGMQKLKRDSEEATLAGWLCTAMVGKMAVWICWVIGDGG